MREWYRYGAVALLLLATLGVCVGYASTDLRSYPDAAEIASTPSAYDGETVLLFAEVSTVDRDNGTLTLLIESGTVVDVSIDGVTERVVRHEIVVRPVAPSVLTAAQTGAEVQAFGTLRDGGTVLEAETLVVDYGGTGDWTYVFGTSILGMVITLGAFFRYWHLDLRRLRIEPRGDRRG